MIGRTVSWQTHFDLLTMQEVLDLISRVRASHSGKGDPWVVLDACDYSVANERFSARVIVQDSRLAARQTEDFETLMYLFGFVSSVVLDGWHGPTALEIIRQSNGIVLVGAFGGESDEYIRVLLKVEVFEKMAIAISNRAKHKTHDLIWFEPADDQNPALVGVIFKPTIPSKMLQMYVQLEDLQKAFALLLDLND